MTPERRVKAASDNLALIRADYEAGLCSKRKVAHTHGISTVTLWRYAKDEGWEYGLKRDEVMQEVSDMSVQRLMAQRGEVIEEHAITLTQLREDLMHADNLQSIKLISQRIEAMLKCIKAERLCYGLSSEIASESPSEALEGLKIIPNKFPICPELSLIA